MKTDVDEESPPPLRQLIEAARESFVQQIATDRKHDPEQIRRRLVPAFNGAIQELTIELSSARAAEARYVTRHDALSAELRAARRQLAELAARYAETVAELERVRGLMQVKRFAREDTVCARCVRLAAWGGKSITGVPARDGDVCCQCGATVRAMLPGETRAQFHARLRTTKD